MAGKEKGWSRAACEMAALKCLGVDSILKMGERIGHVVGRNGETGYGEVDQHRAARF